MLECCLGWPLANEWLQLLGLLLAPQTAARIREIIHRDWILIEDESAFACLIQQNVEVFPGWFQDLTIASRFHFNLLPILLIFTRSWSIHRSQSHRVDVKWSRRHDEVIVRQPEARRAWISWHSLLWLIWEDRVLLVCRQVNFAVAIEIPPQPLEALTLLLAFK